MAPASTFEWGDEKPGTAAPAASSPQDKTFDWGDEDEKPPAKTAASTKTPDASYTPPTGSAKHRFWEGVKAGTGGENALNPGVSDAYMAAHPFAGNPLVPGSGVYRDIKAKNYAGAAGRVLGPAAELALALVPGARSGTAEVPPSFTTPRLSGPVEGEYMPAEAPTPQRWANATVVQPKQLPAEATPATSLPYRRTPGQVAPDVISRPPETGFQIVNRGLKLPSASDQLPAEPPMAYRSRSVGEEGVPYNAGSRSQATRSPEEAQSYTEGRAQVTGQPQEVVGVDLSQTPGFLIVPRENAPDWVKFHGDVPESAVTPVEPPETVSVNGPAWTPPQPAVQWPKAGSPEDTAETMDIQEAIRNRAEGELGALRRLGNEEGYARNTRQGPTKGELTGNQKPVRLTKTPGVKAFGKDYPAVDLNDPEVLEDLVRKSAQAAEKAKKAKK